MRQRASFVIVLVVCGMLLAAAGASATPQPRTSILELGGDPYVYSEGPQPTNFNRVTIRGTVRGDDVTGIGLRFPPTSPNGAPMQVESTPSANWFTGVQPDGSPDAAAAFHAPVSDGTQIVINLTMAGNVAPNSGAFVTLAGPGGGGGPFTVPGPPPPTTPDSDGVCQADGQGGLTIDLASGGSRLTTIPSGEIVLNGGAGEGGGQGCNMHVGQFQRATVRGTPASEVFIVDNGGPGGPLGGEVSVDLGDGTDTLGVVGTDGKDKGTLAPGFTEEDAQRISLNFTKHRIQQDLEATQADVILGIFGLALDIFNVRDAIKERSSASSPPIPVVLDGGAGADRLSGGGADDRILGKGGRDRLKGGAGKDELDGGKGEDDCKGGRGKDTEKRCE